MWFKPETEAKIYLLLRSLKSVDQEICDNIISCEAGPLANCTEWIELRCKVGAPSEKWG
jgi:hypothetical protein